MKARRAATRGRRWVLVGRPAGAGVEGAAGNRTAAGDDGAAGDDADAAHAMVDAAERPLIWAGGAARDRAGEVAAPVLTTYTGRGVLPSAHPCAVGMPPHVPQAGRLWDEADAVIAYGSDLDGVNTQNRLQTHPPRRSCSPP